jgi:hypothetical protein
MYSGGEKMNTPDDQQAPIEKFLDRIVAFEKEIHDCEELPLAMKKKWCQHIREINNKFTKVVQFVGDFVPSMKGEKENVPPKSP